MKKFITIALLVLMIFIVGCKDNSTNATIDVASSINFRCEVDMSKEESPFVLGEGDATYLFKSCFDYKNKASRIKGSEVAVTTDFINIHFVGDSVDNVPEYNGKAYVKLNNNQPFFILFLKFIR